MNNINLNNKIILKDKLNDFKLKYLDNFINDYEWVVFDDKKNDSKYIIFDLQTGDIVESNYTLLQIIDRIVCRALDFEINEHYDLFFDNFDCYNHIEYINYINGLYDIAREYKNNLSEYEKEWLKEIKIRINEMNDFYNKNNK